MKESKAIYVTKRDIKQEFNREYKYYANSITRDRDYSPVSSRYEQKTYEVGCQFDSKRDNLICTCKNLGTIKKRQEVRYIGLPNQIYAYQGSKSFTDIGVGSVKALQRRKVKKIYLPETDDRGVGSSDLSSLVLRRRTRQRRDNSYYDSKRTSSKCVGGFIENKTGCVMSEKLSPIVHTISGSTSPRHSRLNRNIEIGSNTVVKSLTNTTTQVEETTQKGTETKPEKRVEEIIQPILLIKEEPKDMKNKKVDSHKPMERKDVPPNQVYSSDSLEQHVHNLENPSDDKLSRFSVDSEDLMENKLEREYRRIFAAKSKSRDSKSTAERPIPDYKSTSTTLKRRFEALRRGLAKKDSKKNSVILSKVPSQISAASRKDVSINSDPPSLEGRSFSNTRTYTPLSPSNSRDKPVFHPRTSHYRRSVTGTRKERASEQWSLRPDDDDSECQGVKGMFKLWGKKFNLEEDQYKKPSTPLPSFTSKKTVTTKKIQESKVKTDAQQRDEVEKKEGRKFFFFKKKNKEKTYKPKKDVTAGRCEVRDGLVIKIGGNNYVRGEAVKPEEPAPVADNYEDMTRRAWLKKFLTSSIESRNSVQVRWNNKTYNRSSSTVFELMDTVYKDTGVVFRSKSQMNAKTSYKSYTKQHVNFFQQNIEAWMIPKTFTDKPKLLPDKVKCKSNEDRKDNIEVRISDQKWFIDKSKAFSHKIEVVLHSKNFRKLNKAESSDYLRIDIPKDFFVDSSSDDKNSNNQFSDEKVYKIVEYETASDLKKQKARNFDTGDYKENNVKVNVSVQESKDGVLKILEPTKPPVKRDVVIQGSNVYIPKRCDVIGVGIITQREMREIRKPILKIADVYSDDESQHNILKTQPKKCEFAESYLQDYYRNWTPLGMDLYSWCVSDSHLRCCSENSKSSFKNHQGDGTKSCPNIFDDFQASTIVSSCETSSCSQCCHNQDDIDKPPAKVSWFGKFLKKPKDSSNIKKEVVRTVLPKDSVEVFKRRKIYAASMKSKWADPCPDFSEPYSVPSNESKSAQNTLTECPKLKKSCCKPVESRPKTKTCKKHVSLPDCEAMNQLLAKQLANGVPEGILAFKGGPNCEACKKKTPCTKHAKVNPIPSCEIPRQPCKDSCESMKKAPCDKSKEPCDDTPPCPGAQCRTPSCPPSPPCCKRTVSCQGPPCKSSCPPKPCMKPPSCSSTPTSCPSMPSCPPSPNPGKKPPPCPRKPCKNSPTCPPTPPCCPPTPPSCPSTPRSCPPSPPPNKKKKSPPPCPSPPLCCPPSPPPCKKPPPCPRKPCKKPPNCPPTPPSCPPSPPPSKKKKSPPPCPSPPLCCPPSPPPCKKPPSCCQKPCKKPPSCPPTPPSCPSTPPSCPPTPPSCPSTTSCPPSPPPCKKKKSPPSCPPTPPSCPSSPPPCMKKKSPFTCPSPPPPCPPSPPRNKKAPPPPCPPPPPPSNKIKISRPPSPPTCKKKPPPCPPSPPPCRKPPSPCPTPPCPSCPKTPPACKKHPSFSSTPPCRKPPSCPPTPPPCQKHSSRPTTPPPRKKRPSCPPTPPPCKKSPSCPPTPPPCQKHSSRPSTPPPCKKRPSCPSTPPPCKKHPSCPPSPPQCKKLPSCPPSPCKKHPSGQSTPPPCIKPCCKKPPPCPASPCPPSPAPCRRPCPPTPQSPPSCIHARLDSCPPSPARCPYSTPPCPYAHTCPFSSSTCPNAPPCPHNPPPCPHTPLCPHTPPCPHTKPCPAMPLCQQPPSCIHVSPCNSSPCCLKKCPLAPPSCPASRSSCCSAKNCPLPPCKKASSSMSKKCSQFFKKKIILIPTSPPCKPTCKSSFSKSTCQASQCQTCQKFSTSSFSYGTHPTSDAPFVYSPIHPCPIEPEKPKKVSLPCDSSPCNTRNPKHEPPQFDCKDPNPVKPGSRNYDQCRRTAVQQQGDDFPWPTKNQISNQSSITSLFRANDLEKIEYGKCKKDCPMLPKLSCDTIPSPKKECKTSCPNKQGTPRPPCMPEMQCPAPRPPSPPPELPKKLTNPECRSKSKIAGLSLKMQPGVKKKSTCSKNCLAWDMENDDGCISLNSAEKITIRLKKETPSTTEIREGMNIKVQDEDGMTLFERKDYRLQHADCSSGQRPSLLGEMYKASEVRRLTTNNSVQALVADEDCLKGMSEVKSDASVANLIEIQFKLKVTQGEKTTEINIANDGDRENEVEEKIERNEGINQMPQEVFIMKNGCERLTDHSDQKNDVNIRIVIKNFKPKTGKKSVCVKHGDYSKEFSKKISAKFHTVSTGYSDEFNDEQVFSVHRATVDLTSSFDKSKTYSNRSEEMMSEQLTELGRGLIMGSSEPSICRCVTDMSEGKSEDTEAKSVSHKYSATKDIQDETDTEKLTDHKYEYTEETDTEKPIKYDTEETDTEKQVEPKYDTETDTEKRPKPEYDTFMSTDTDEPDKLPEIKKSDSIDVIVKPHSKEEKKEMLKQVMEKAHETKTKTKTRIRKLRDMLKVILTSDSSDHEELKPPTNDKTKDVAYASLQPNYFRDNDSLNNYYRESHELTDEEINRAVVYPTITNSDGSDSNHSDVLSSENESPPQGGCMCSTVAARLKLASRIEGGGCCCASKPPAKKNEEVTCDLKKESDFFQYEYQTPDYVDAETQNSRYLTNKMNNTNLSAHVSVKTSATDGSTVKDGKSKSGVINVNDTPFNIRKTFSPHMVHVRECEMRKMNRNTMLSISDEDKIVLHSGNSTKFNDSYRLKYKDTKKKTQDPKGLAIIRASDILQSYETKKAVLEIYTEKTVSEGGERLVAKLPKFVYDREHEIQTNYEAMASNTYKTVCKRNIVMMAINR